MAATSSPARRSGRREHALHLAHGSNPGPPLGAIAASARLDVLVFTGATGILLLHGVIDSLVAPEPGTGPSDHVLRGFATFSVLVLAAIVYPRLAAGGRAALAAALGALSVEGAALAIADARAVGARGEDWSGFLLFRSALHCSGSPLH